VITVLDGCLGTPTSTAVSPTGTATGSVPTNTAIAGTSTPSSVAATRTPSPSATVAIPTVCSITFSDVPESHTFYPFVRCLACRGIISGYADGTFRPGNDVTRGQLSKVVSSAAGFNTTPTGQTFEDVSPDDTFYEFIERMASRGVISGYECGGPGEPCGNNNRPYFRPGNNASRGQLSKITSNAAGYIEPVSGQFYADVDDSNPFYAEISRLTVRGVIGGYPCGGAGEPCDSQNRPYFRWGSNVTRGQMSKIVSNTFYPSCRAQLDSTR
ncbi:MAG TPA: S-layer homology domain-containing protein, partial [Chloroflexia bacterium]|nr:S-layer homology domain-containing protein [Chloroflexia bacterium]